MKLDTLGGQLAVAQRHQHSAAVSGGFQAIGQFGVNDERVIAPDSERAGEPVEDGAAVVLDHRGLAVDWFVHHDAATEGLRHGLVTQADAERGDAGLGAAHDLQRDPGLVGRTGSGRNDAAIKAVSEQCIHGGLVVSDH